MAMTVTVIQFTDTHLLADPEGRLYGVNTYRSLSDVVAFAEPEQPDLILLTGDISQDETADSYRHAYHLVSRLGVEIGYLPGNHDRFAVMSEALNHAGRPVRPERSLVCQGWLIVLLDSTIEGHIEGAVPEAELERLERELCAHSEKHVLVCLHHNPFPLPGAFGSIGLENADQLFAVVKRHKNVRAVLCGHVHQEFDGERDGVRLFASPSTCFQFKPQAEVFCLDGLPAGYRILRLRTDGAIETQVCRLKELPEGLNLNARTSK